ncbi:hypothetical protein [Haloarcula sp. CGMCC 1.6347]|uniref:hypothetical protein n=1 Tax=Haloarcula sp. CGMCC 1.6347 TaxID=3111455 RepID=UPI00300F08AA
MSHARSILLAGLLVLSTVVTGVGPALAQTATDSGPVTYEYTGSPETLVIDTSALDGGTEFKVEYITQGGPSTGTTVLARETYNTANLDGDVLLFLNSGAYESVNVTVSEYSGGEPKFDTWDGRGETFHTKVGTTGGDSDLTCDVSDKIADVVGYVDSLDCTPQPGSTTVNTSGLEANDAEIEIYQSGVNHKAGFENFNTTLNNYLQDTKTQALILGKNAYIRALNNGSSKSAAKADAKEAAQDYYAKKQVQLARSWDQGAAQAVYLQKQENTAGAGTATVEMNTVPPLNGFEPSNSRPVAVVSDNETQTLANGSTIQTDGIEITGYDSPSDSGPNTAYLNIMDDEVNDISNSGNAHHTDGVKVSVPHSSEYESKTILRTQWYAEKWSEINTQSSNVDTQLDTLAENTYSAYQNGEINNSDLVDPYVLASQQSAGSDFQGWTAAKLTLLGTNSPENFDQIGSFNVTTGDGTQYEGVLFSQENPASGQFENGTTYHTSNIGGTQYVVTSDRIVELDGEFTIDSISTQDGQTVQNVTIQKTTYETTNVTELKQQYEDLAKRRAEIEAREQNLRGSAGGGLLGGSSSSFVLVLVGVGVLYAVSQRRTGGNN